MDQFVDGSVHRAATGGSGCERAVCGLGCGVASGMGILRCTFFERIWSGASWEVPFRGRLGWVGVSTAGLGGRLGGLDVLNGTADMLLSLCADSSRERRRNREGHGEHSLHFLSMEA